MLGQSLLWPVQQTPFQKNKKEERRMKKEERREQRKKMKLSFLFCTLLGSCIVICL
jgi:hypothetical protein